MWQDFIKFTFHYGSILIMLGLIIKVIVNIFTFHYGSILIIFDIQLQQMAIIFTFHYGSILINIFSKMLLSIVDLHSTMVLF